MRILSALAALLLLALPAVAQSPASFTYQGRLDSAGAPANGNFDLRFRVLLIDGTQAGPTVCLLSTPVADGLFTAQLDFGHIFTTSIPKYLQVQVRPATGLDCSNLSGYTILAPASPITAAPLAAHALSANALWSPSATATPAVAVDTLNRVGIGTTSPLAALDVRSGGGSYIRVDSPNGDLRFNGGADGFFGFYNEGAAAGRTEFLSSAGVNLSIANSTGNVGIGAAPSSARLHVSGNVSVTGALTTGPQTSYKSIHGSAFIRRNDHQNANDLAEIDLDGTTGSGGSCDTPAWFYAPVELPHGATVTGVIFYYYDNSTCGGFSAEFARVNLLSATVSYLASLPYEDFNGVTIKTIGTTSITNPVIDNFNYAYVLRCRMQGFPRLNSNHMRIVGARIAYTVTSPVP